MTKKHYTQFLSKKTPLMVEIGKKSIGYDYEIYELTARLEMMREEKKRLEGLILDEIQRFEPIPLEMEKAINLATLKAEFWHTERLVHHPKPKKCKANI